LERKLRVEILVLLVMSILTAAYLALVVYANTDLANNDKLYPVYAAFEYKSQPSTWNTTEELGIIEVIEYGNETSYWLHVVVDPDKEPFPLQEVQPIFKYKDKFFQVSALWATPSLPDSIKQYQTPIGVAIGLGWVAIGIVAYGKKDKKIATAMCLLLLPGIIGSALIASVKATDGDSLCATPALPENIPKEPINKEPISATNYQILDWQEDILNEIYEMEGINPIYVLVFGDEEERNIYRSFPSVFPFPPARNWTEWATYQIERGDEALCRNFSIDIRILGFLNWESNDGFDSMYNLWYQLEGETKSYLRTWYTGKYWSNYVDAIIGITAQDTPATPIAGLSSGPDYLKKGRVQTLLKWQCYWADDNLVQHEVSALFYATDHIQGPCCVMALHTHYYTTLYEDGWIWLVFNDVYCAYTSYTWCCDCYGIIYIHRFDYMLNDPRHQKLPWEGSCGGVSNYPR
jgi:hypothetical protein